LRLANRVNPSSHGRYWVTEISKRIGVIPKDGTYQLESGIKMQLKMADFIESSIYFDAYEFTCRRVILDNLATGSVFVDIGANIGYYSLLAHRKVGFSGRVLAFEPNPNVVERFKANVLLNSAERIELFETALSDREGEVDLYCPIGETHGEVSIRNLGWQEGSCHMLRAKVTRLDDILPKNIQKIDLIKIDVEGAENLIIAGGIETIRKFKPRIILELNKKASQFFDSDVFDAARMLLSINNEYRPKLIGTHKVVDMTWNDLFKSDIVSSNLLLY
jgi:FkbM family methyltransferase